MQGSGRETDIVNAGSRRWGGYSGNSDGVRGDRYSEWPGGRADIVNAGGIYRGEG
ncbi:unnamed protein product [Staurois parvus]|uniref:Uncharacterized protein n=1 Tax=Staurois parvus TaxID=386267 RepID=A0ABN9F6W2_9NEOB|nr:unnamed protein product [Staurois parvus]